MGQEDPISVTPDLRKEVRIRGIFPEVPCMSLYPIAGVLERVRHALAEVAVSEKRELMLRIRRRVLL